jgi:hypothetical protein
MPRTNALFALCVVAIAAQAANREKTDVVALRNGDRVTCEVISLEYGLLEVKTSNMGTLRIEWPAVRSIDSRYTFYVERVGAQHYFGSIATGAAAEALTITDAGSSQVIPMAQVARLSQVDSGFWERVDGSLALGYNFTKSSDVSITSVTMNAQYAARTLQSALNVSMVATKSPDGGTSDRDQIQNTVRFLRPTGNFWQTLAALERNEELGLEGRVQLGGAIGRHFVQRSDMEATGYIGMAYNHEWATGTEGAQKSVEGLLGAEWRIFRFADPEISLVTSLVGYPSLTESDRYRAELNSTLSRELIKDLTLDLTFYGSYDSEPPDPTSAQDDYGVVTSLGYKF